MTTNCNLIIPTYNRPNYLHRILDYYQRYGGDFKIIVADSSSENNKKLNEKNISSFPDLNILYLNNYSEQIYPWHKYADVVTYAKSKYSVFCADDDFIVPSAIKECVNFMEKNPDYSVAQGLYCSHSLKKRKNGKIEFSWVAGSYHHKSITFDNPADRLTFHLSHHHTSTFYGVHRTDTLRFIFKEVTETTSYGRLGEILLTALTLICGKMEILPIFYASRESGSSSEKSYNPRPYFFLPWTFFLTGDTYKTEYKRAVACLARNLQKQIELDSDLSTKIAEEALNGYLDSVRIGHLQKIRDRLVGLLISKTLPETYLRKLRLAYERMDNIRTNIQLRGVRREYSDFLEKNDSTLYENLNGIREAVINNKRLLK